MKTLSLLIPGLLGPLPELNDSDITLSECRVLNTWLARADKHTTQGNTYYKQLAELFAVSPDFSIAYTSASHDQCDCSEAYWYRADPVHFKADIDHAILFDSEQLNIQHSEALSLADEFNRHFSEDGLKLVAAHAERWYLQSQTELNITTTPLGDAAGRNVSHFLPQGEGALNWRRLLNETQMLFHAYPINEQRENNGQLSINSLWLWGEGQPDLLSVDHAEEPLDFKWLMTNEAVASGLSMLLNCDPMPMVKSAVEISGFEEDGLIVIDALMNAVNQGDVLTWQAALLDVCEQWFLPLNKMLKNNKIKQINLYTAEGRLFVLTSKKLLKFWHRPASIQAFMNKESINQYE